MKYIFCLLLLVPFVSAQTTQTASPAQPASPAQSTSTQPGSTTPTPTPAQITHMENMLQDWPDLVRYRNENAALPAPAPGENRVVFMGDSITDAWGHGENFFSGMPYVNRGISGQTTPQMLI